MKLLDLAVRIAFGSFLCGLVVAEAQAEQVARVKFPIDPLHLNDVGAGTPSDPLQGIMSAISKPFQDLANFISSDAAGAAALATVVPGLQDTNGQACWLKMQDARAGQGRRNRYHPLRQRRQISERTFLGRRLTRRIQRC